MNYRTRSVLFFLPVFLMMVLMACRTGGKTPGSDKDDVKAPNLTEDRAGTDLKSLLQTAAGNGDRI